MVQPSKPSSETLQNYQGIGVPDESLAVILQRGRDQLLLSKADDRFIVPLPMLVGMRQPKNLNRWLQSQARNYRGLTLGIAVRSNGLLGGVFVGVSGVEVGPESEFD